MLQQHCTTLILHFDTILVKHPSYLFYYHGKMKIVKKSLKLTQKIFFSININNLCTVSTYQHICNNVMSLKPWGEHVFLGLLLIAIAPLRLPNADIVVLKSPYWTCDGIILIRVRCLHILFSGEWERPPAEFKSTCKRVHPLLFPENECHLTFYQKKKKKQKNFHHHISLTQSVYTETQPHHMKGLCEKEKTTCFCCPAIFWDVLSSWLPHKKTQLPSRHQKNSLVFTVLSHVQLYLFLSSLFPTMTEIKIGGK